jgi:hypothetical protein
MTKNKKNLGIVIIILVLAGFYLASKTDFFSVFIPDVGQPSGTDGLVNPVYYGEVTQNPSFECSSTQEVVFRSTFDYSGSSFPSSGDEIAVDTGGSELTRYEYKRYATAIQDVPCDDPQYGTVLVRDFGTLKLLKRSRYAGYFIGHDTSSGGCYAKGFGSGGTIETSKDVLGANYEVIEGITYLDKKYSCSNGDVLLYSCNDQRFEMTQDCPSNQQCQYYSSWEDLGAAVKCGDVNDKYIPNKKLCVGNILYSTNSEGNGITSVTCGQSCNPITLSCVDCSDGEKRCAQNPSTTTDIEICTNGAWVEWTSSGATCTGADECVDGECIYIFKTGDKRCYGKQPQVYSSSNSWVDDGDSCDLSCTQISQTEVECQKECELGHICVAGLLQECLDTDRDNELTNIGTCVSGSCEDNSHCKPSRELGTEYCSEGVIKRVVSSGNEFDLNGGVELITTEESCTVSNETPAIYCGDGICDSGEICSTCEADCGTCLPDIYCGDGICNGEETCSDCSQDCGECAAETYCGDETCNGDETCATCEADCGTCDTTTNGDGTTTDPDDTTPSEPKKKSSWTIIIAILVIIGVLYFIFWRKR